MSALNFVHPFNSWWTFELFPHFCQLWIMPVWSFVYKLCRLTFSFWGGKQLTEELLRLCGKFMFNILRNSQNIFQSYYHFTFLWTTHEVSSFSISSPATVIIAFIIVIFVGAKCHLIIILISIFLITNDIGHIFMSYWSFTYSFSWSLYSKIFPNICLIIGCKSSTCIMTQVPYQIYDLQIVYILWLAFLKYLFIYLAVPGLSQSPWIFDLCCSMWNP